MAKHPEPVRPTVMYLIRHCEPEETYLNQYYGQMDVPLGQRGLEQSRQVAERLADVPFDAIYASDLERAGHLADLMAEPRGLPVRRLTVFRERHMGVLQGIPIETLERDHAELYNSWRADRINFRVPEGESFLDLSERIVPATLDLAAAFPAKRVALVGHAGPIRVTLAHALGLPLENIFRLGVGHGSIHVIEYSSDSHPPRVTLVNG